MHSYSNEFAYSEIGNIMRKIQNVYAGGVKDGSLTYDYTYHYTTPCPHAVSKINENLTYRYDANGNMIAIYDTAKNFNRVLYWDDENRLTKSVDTTNGGRVATEYAYDTKGMRIIKDGPYGKSIYVDTGYVISNSNLLSNHVFVGNTRIASVVKHKEETQAAMYFYASDHLGSSSVLTTNNGTYHERIEYLPYGETWVEDAAQSGGYSTPYKFTGKDLDKETGLYYFGARYLDPKLAVWVSVDPALAKYLPTKKDEKLPGLGGVFNDVNLNLYHYAGLNPVKFVDPDGNAHISEYNGWYAYKADDRFDKVIKSAYGWIPVVGCWVYDALNKIFGKTELGKNENVKKIGSTIVDTVSLFGKLKDAGNFAKKIGKSAATLGFIFNSVDSIKSLTENINKVEIAIERLRLLEGKDKEFIEMVAPYVEQSMASLIKQGSVKVDNIDWGGFADSFSYDPEKVNLLRNSIKELKVLWDKNKK